MSISLFSILSDDIVNTCIREWLQDASDLISLDISLTNRDLRKKYLNCYKYIRVTNSISFNFTSQSSFKRFAKYVSDRSIYVSRLFFRKCFEFPYFLDENTLECFRNLQHLHLNFGDAIFLSSKSANSYSRPFFVSQLLTSFPRLEHLSLQFKTLTKDNWHQIPGNLNVTHKLKSFTFHTNHISIDELLCFFCILSYLCPAIERLHITDGIPLEVMHYIRSLFPNLSHFTFFLNEYSIFYDKNVVQNIRRDLRWQDIMPIAAMNTIETETANLEQAVSTHLFTPFPLKIIQYNYDDHLEIIEKTAYATNVSPHDESNLRLYRNITAQPTQPFFDDEENEEFLYGMNGDDFSNDEFEAEEDDDEDDWIDLAPIGLLSETEIHPSIEVYEQIIKDSTAISAWKQSIFRYFHAENPIFRGQGITSLNICVHVTERPMKLFYSALTFSPQSTITHLTIDADLVLDNRNTAKLQGILIYHNIPTWTHLLSLTVTNNTLVTDAIIESICNHCPLIESLVFHLGRNCIMTDCAMYALTNQLRALESFELSGAMYITDAGVQSFQREKTSRLVSIALQYCDQITPIGIKSLFMENGGQLENIVINCSDAYHHYTAWYCWLALQQALDHHRNTQRLKSFTLLTYKNSCIPVNEIMTSYIPNIPFLQTQLLPPSFVTLMGKSLQRLCLEMFPMNITMLQSLCCSCPELIELSIKLQELPLEEELLDTMMYGNREIEERDANSHSLLLFDAIDLDTVSFENLSHLKIFYIAGRVVRIGYDKLVSLLAWECPYLQDCQIYTYVKETFLPSRQQLTKLRKMYQHTGKKIEVVTRLCY